jgi:HEAT repeat protein
MRARRLLLAGAAVALAALAAVLLLRRPAPPPPSPGPPPLLFRAGDRLAYRLRIDSALRLPGEAEAGARTVPQVVAGTLHVLVLEAGAGGARLALQLGEATLTLAGQGSPALDAQLRRAFVAEIDPDGAFQRFEFPPAVGAEARRALEETVRTFEAVVPAGAGLRWEAVEQHGSGRYRAAYRYTSDGRILKTKLGYLPPGDGGATPGMSVRRAEATIRVEPGASWIARMVGEEELAALLPTGMRFGSTLRAELVRDPALVPLASGLELDAAPSAPGALGPWLARMGPAAAPEPAVALPARAPRSFAELLRALDGPRLSASAMIELRDLLLQDPALAARVLAQLRAGGSDRAAAALLAALGMAATEECQAALRTVLADPGFGRMNRIRAALALGGGSDLRDESLAALRQAADGRRSDGLADTALLALGTAGSTLRAGGAAGYGPVRDDLVQRLGRAHAAGDAATALLALGNTRDPALAAAAAARLEDPAPAVRTAAAQALAKLGREADGARLAARLSAEPDAEARTAAARALNALPAPSADTLALAGAALAREPDPEARYELARLVGEHLERYPGGRAALAALARSDPSQRIREYAAGKVR